MATFNDGRACLLDQRTGAGLGLVLLVLGTMLSAGAVDLAHAASKSNRSETAEADDQLIRRCEWRSKIEICYWRRVGSQHTSEH